MSKPKPCRYERTLGYRAVKGEHADDCTTPLTHRGCVECTAPHCGVCSRKHLEDQHPLTCPSCVGSVREDLTEIGEHCRQLRRQAVDAEGYEWASARIPGATAMVLMGPQVDPDNLVVSNRLALEEQSKIHRPRDPMPPLTVLARWEEIWADWLGQTRDGRATITRTLGYLDQHLTGIAQARTEWRDDQLVTPPEFPEFASAIAKVRIQLEQVLHDESGDDEGIACFECGHQLVRRIRDPKRCRHKTPARTALAEHLRNRVDPAAWLQLLRSYDIPAWDHEIDAARLPTPVEIAKARLPCERCDQGGVTDPTPGISWECPSCRMRYTPGQYAHAVRRDLADRQYIAEGSGEQAPLQSYGWTEVGLAADAASTLVGYQVTALTVRRWMDRNKIAACCTWSYDERPNGELIPRTWGQRLVFWPDVADEANAARDRAAAAAIARANKAVRDAAKQVLAEVEANKVHIPETVEKELLGQVPVTTAGDLDEPAFRLLVHRAVSQLEPVTSGRISA